MYEIVCVEEWRRGKPKSFLLYTSSSLARILKKSRDKTNGRKEEAIFVFHKQDNRVIGREKWWMSFPFPRVLCTLREHKMEENCCFLITWLCCVKTGLFSGVLGICVVPMPVSTCGLHKGKSASQIIQISKVWSITENMHNSSLHLSKDAEGEKMVRVR